MSYVEHCKKHGQYHGEICGECFEELQKAYYEQEEELDATMMAFQMVQTENSKLRAAFKELEAQNLIFKKALSAISEKEGLDEYALELWSSIMISRASEALEKIGKTK